MIIKTNCLNCGKKFRDYLSRHHQKFCSRSCRAKMTGFQKGHKINLGKHHSEKTKRKIALNGFHYGMKGKNHTEECKKKISKALSGEKSYLWKGGKFQDKKLYWWIYNPEHPFPNCHKYIFKHRLIAEQYLGRYLTKEERIHHINGIKNDNRPENLYLFPSNGEHWKYHLLKNKPTIQSNLLTYA